MLVLPLFALLVQQIFAAKTTQAKATRTSSAPSSVSLIDPLRHHIFVLFKSSFDKTLTTDRKNGVVSVLFYRNDNSCKNFIEKEYNDIGKDLSGMVKIAALDCDADDIICKQENITAYPTVKIFPQTPIPSYIFEGEIKKLKATLLSLIPADHLTIFTGETKTDNVDKYLSSEISIPKVLLFSNKNKPSPMFKSLSNAFHDRVNFLFVSQDSKTLHDRFAISVFPTLVVLKGEGSDLKKAEKYDGDMNYNSIHEWINIRSETFVKGGGYTTEMGGKIQEDAKPWTVQKVPEMNKASHLDVCFRRKGFCVIFMIDGEPDANQIGVLEKLSDEFGLDGRTKFRWSWINTKIEETFKKIVEPEITPSVVVFNPHKRIRFVKLSSDPTEDSIRSFVNVILQGDARFTNVKGNKIPQFKDRAAAVHDVQDEL